MATFPTSVKAPIFDCKRRVITLRRSKTKLQIGKDNVIYFSLYIPEHVGKYDMKIGLLLWQL